MLVRSFIHSFGRAFYRSMIFLNTLANNVQQHRTQESFNGIYWFASPIFYLSHSFTHSLLSPFPMICASLIAPVRSFVLPSASHAACVLAFGYSIGTKCVVKYVDSKIYIVHFMRITSQYFYK